MQKTRMLLYDFDSGQTCYQMAIGSEVERHTSLKEVATLGVGLDDRNCSLLLAGPNIPRILARLYAPLLRAEPLNDTWDARLPARFTPAHVPYGEEEGLSVDCLLSSRVPEAEVVGWKIGCALMVAYMS